jgi:hypothetical protein
MIINEKDNQILQEENKKLAKILLTLLQGAQISEFKDENENNSNDIQYGIEIYNSSLSKELIEEILDLHEIMNIKINP